MNPVCLGLEVIVLGARLCFGDPAPSRVATIPVCAVSWPRGRDFQRLLSAELRAMPPGAAAESALAEWISLRDQARACQGLR